jgi:hypothetical protein
MAGTPRDIAYLEDKFQTDDVPSQQDFYDLFASFLHYLKIKQATGNSTSDVMSQKAVSDAITQVIADLKGGVPVGGDTLKKLYDLINAVSLDLDSVLTTGNSANGKRITNLLDPAAAQDADTLAARNAALASLTRNLDQVLTAGNSANGRKITNLLDPTAAQDADTKAARDAAMTTAVNQLIDGATDNTLKKLQDKITAINAIIGGSAPDGDSIVNTVAELLAVFSTYTEGVNIVTLLGSKVNTSDVYNALDQALAGKVLDARQGKVLKDLIDALTTASVPDSTNRRYVTDAQLVVIGNTSGTNSGNETVATVGALINGATNKATPIDADYVGLMDSAASNVLKKLSWANIKATLKTYFDSLYQAALTSALFGTFITVLTGKTTPVDADTIAISDSVASDAAKKVTWANIKATLLTTWKDATGGFVGLTLFKINFKNAANSFTSFLQNTNTAARTYTFQDRDGTIADNTDLALKANLAANTTLESLADASDEYGLGMFSRTGAFFRSASVKWNETLKQLKVDGTQAIWSAVSGVTDGNMGIKALESVVESFKIFDDTGNFITTGVESGKRFLRHFTARRYFSGTNYIETEAKYLAAPISATTLIKSISTTNNTIIVVSVDNICVQNVDKNSIIGRAQFAFKNDAGTLTQISQNFLRYDNQYSTIKGSPGLVTSSDTRIDASVSGTTISINIVVVEAKLTDVNCEIKHTITSLPL